ncbi:MAG: DpnII family type II restriction endonuclease [Acidobacteriota bacterium]|nr:DpnII family type II restriction endonuclease [Acidobacteriota bacterium]
MQLRKVTLEEILGEIEELPSDWMDEKARALESLIKLSLGRLRGLNRPVMADDLLAELRTDPRFLEICRLFLGKGQEPAAHVFCEALGVRVSWTKLQAMARQEPERLTKALDSLKFPELIQSHLERRWQAEDILIERYKMSRGRAIAGQRRGRSLEDDVAAVLKELRIPFDRGVSFLGKRGATAKCDFAIPGRDRPKVVIEAKGFEATGSKLTDFIGDILKIAQAKDFHMYFFLVTDGRGWHNRVSDLRKIVEFHDENLIDMIYTRVRLSDLAVVIRHIWENE